MARARKGRRPGNPDTRGQILGAAVDQFAREGYVGASIRGIARAAGVDPSLVLHYFESKEQLFVASLRVPVNPAAVVRGVLEDAEADELGTRLIDTLLGVWDEPANRGPLVAVLRSATGAGPIGSTVGQFIQRAIVAAFADRLPGPDARLRATLIGSQVVGLLLARYVLEIEPLASADRAHLTAIYGPTIQRYAYGDLPPD